MTSVIEFKNFSFAYPADENSGDDKLILGNINLKIEEGEFVVLYGPTGSGKSTLLRQIKRQIKPHGISTGEVLYFGKNIDEIDEMTSVCEIGFVFQDPENQMVADEVWHELAFSLENIGMSTREMRKKIGEMACFFGIEDLLDKSVRELSGGQKQIVNLCSVLLLQPKILILDEPISQLDPINAREFLTIISRVIREFDITVILSEHRLEDIYFAVDRVIALENGEIVHNNIPDITARATADSKRLQNFLPELARLYFKYEREYLIMPKTIREYKLWLKSFEIRENLQKADDINSDSKREIISCKNINFAYSKSSPNVLKDLSLSINSGEILSVLGGNGAGKSTLFRVLCGILKPQRGKIINKSKAKIGYLAQSPKAYFLYETVEQELYSRAKSANTDLEYIDYLVKLFKAEKILKLHPHDISGGEQQIAAFLVVMLENPDVLLLDEPTKGLDPNIKRDFFDILLKLKKDGKAIVMATHDIEFAAKYSDSCCFLFNGEIIQKYEAREFFSGNYFYTTAVNRVFRNINKNIVCSEDVDLVTHP